MRRVNGRYAELAALVKGAGRKRGADTVGEAFFFADAPPQARIGRAAEQVVADDEGDIVRMIVAQLQAHAGAQHRIGLVRGFDDAVDWWDGDVRAGNARVGLRAFPVAEKLLRQLGNFFRIEVTDKGQLAVRCAVKIAVAFFHLIERERLDALEALVQRGDVKPVRRRIRRHVTAEQQAGLRARFAALGLDRRQRCELQLFEFFFREGRGAQHLGHQFQGLGQVGAHRLDGCAFAAYAHLRAQLVEGVAQLLARVLLRAAHQHGAGDAAGGGAVFLAALVAPADAQRRDDSAAAGFLGQHHQLHATGQGAADHTLLDIGRGRVKGVSSGDLGLALVVFERECEVGHGGNLRPLRFCRRNEHTQRAVARLEVKRGGRLYFGQFDLLDAVAVQEQQAPVADGDVLGDGGRQGARVGEHVLNFVEQPRARALELVDGERFGGDVLQRLEHGLACGVQ